MRSYLAKHLIIYFICLLLNGDAAHSDSRRKREKQDSLTKTEAGHSNTNETARMDDCPFYKDNHPERMLEIIRYRFLNRYKNPKMAYRMAILASISYWEFHKSTELVIGFRLLQDRHPRTSNRSRLRYQACRLIVKSKSIRKYLHNIVMKGNFPLSTVFYGSKHSVSSRKVCKKEKTRKPDRNKYIFQYSLYNWYEPSVPGVNFHDTDLLISNSEDEKELVIAFGGSASAADAVTNMQTFEPVQHAAFFLGNNGNQSVIEGSIHRGIFNAYSRVVHGSILRLNHNVTANILSSLNSKFGHCWGNNKHNKTNNSMKEGNDKIENSSNAQGKPDNVKERRNGGCEVRNEKLFTILRKVAIDALRKGLKLSLTGHSLGGGLATLLALDIIINFPEVSVTNLHVFTFGEPQIADDIFLQSAIEVAPRLKAFVDKNGNGQFHRFVTLSDKCTVDAIADVTKRTLASYNSARKLGGVKGNITHFVEAHYLLTPDQCNILASRNVDNASIVDTKTSTRSAFAAHKTMNYLSGISRESRSHPLSSDFPLKISEWLGEPNTLSK